MNKFAFGIAAIFLAAGPVAAQDYSLAAHSGEADLVSGFPEDPYVVAVQAGGTRPATNAADGCAGMISNAPDFKLTYSAGSLPLVFRTRSGTDTTLVINGPDGRWYCDDDSGGNLDAEVAFSNPDSGRYDVWIGTFGGGVEPADLLITELP